MASQISNMVFIKNPILKGSWTFNMIEKMMNLNEFKQTYSSVMEAAIRLVKGCSK
jgi:hypothetical protein